MIDSHVHWNRREFNEDRDETLKRARQAGVKTFLNVGFDLQSSAESLALAQTHNDFLASAGIHPHDAILLADAEGSPQPEAPVVLDKIRSLAKDPNLVAIGEIGLDFFRDLSPRLAQFTALKLQLELAEELSLPVVFHIRDAWQETLDFVNKVGVPSKGGILHAFSGDESSVQWAKNHGFLLGIGGPVTYKNSNLDTLVVSAGVENLVLETDAPWLPPVPFRGKRNESAFLIHTLEKTADVLGLSPEDVDKQTTANFLGLFGGGSLDS